MSSCSEPPGPFGGGHEVDGPGGREVEEVHLPTGEPDQREIAGQHQFLCLGGNAGDGIQILTNPPGAPRANAICELMIGTLHRETARQGPSVSKS